MTKTMNYERAYPPYLTCTAYRGGIVSLRR